MFQIFEVSLADIIWVQSTIEQGMIWSDIFDIIDRMYWYMCIVYSNNKQVRKRLGGLYHFPPKFALFFCMCHNFSPPLFCANNYSTSLLLIVCALRWYVKSHYRHFFLEDIASTQGSLKKWHFLICKYSNSKAPRATDPKFPVWLVIWLSHNYNAVKCWIDTRHFISNRRQKPRNICNPASSNHHNSTLHHGKNNFSQSYHSLGLLEATTQVWGL